MTNPADHSAADGAAMRHTLTVQETVETPSGGELDLDALEPCPFCGSPARSHTYRTESLFSHDEVEYLQIGCRADCDIFMCGEQHDEVRAAWNTRVPALARQAPAPSGREEDWKVVVDRIAPAMRPMDEADAEQYPAEWCLYQDRERIRRELLALSRQAASAAGGGETRSDVEPGCSLDDLPKRGEVRVIDGQRCRFIEREVEGDKWEVLGPATTPPSAAVLSPVGGEG